MAPTKQSDRDMLNTAEAAEYLGLQPDTLERWRRQGRGPKYIRMEGWAIRYRRCDLESFIKQSTVETEDEDRK